MSIEAMADQATKRITQHINRSAGQHLRAMKQSITNRDLYAIGMESSTAYRLMPQLCTALGITYPPRNES